MTPEEAIAFLRPALEGTASSWLDLGAGTGVFTAALATLLGPDGHVLAIERDASALRQLRERARQRASAEASITVAEGDVAALDAVAEVHGQRWGGALLANVLHYVADPAPVVESVVRRIETGGRLAIVEYDRVTSNAWVPYPLSQERLATLVARLGLPVPHVRERRPSRYGSTLYLATIDVA